ncbi:hypothetical protein GCM10011444_19110 [Winogradskyella haliclonae]|uniref:DUF1579 domain-containing protein n=2 Tax=Winogradskyella haliclonae TaxID=2048558 RepID=A0ABQ2BYL6_9FLAO|nr:hypothetical protein GCM10011444_19110 [Winogradskyella haliclonae]
MVSLISITSNAQEESYTCQNPLYNYLSTIIGDWEVKTKDRTSPGVYENNKGNSKITNLIEGCGIKESYRGSYKSRKYAREVMIVGQDSISVQMSALDSEHGSFSILNGKIENDKLVIYWFRNIDVKKLQSKYILSIENKDKFEFSSYLSTDYGKNWALTHKRIYSRID